MTHSHDTSTPAVSDETVPSEEFVLVPKEFLDFLRHAPVGSGTCCCGDDMQKHSNSEHSPVDMWDHELDQWLKQIATLPASHLAKEGGEAGAAAPPAKLAHRIVLHCQNTPPEEAIEIAERLIVTALNHPMNVPQHSPALAKGGDAVREAVEEARSLLKVEYYDDGRIAAVGHDSDGLRKMVALLDAALSTPTEGPASQTEGMGGDAKKLRENIEAFLEMHRRGVLTPRTPNIPIELLQKARAALTPPETAEAVPVASDPAPATDDRGRLVEALRAADSGLAAMIRLSEMGLEESLREPEESGNFASFEQAKRCLATVRAVLATEASR